MVQPGCSTWKALATFVADDIPDAEASISEQYKGFYVGHLHDAKGGLFQYFTEKYFGNIEWRERVKMINQEVFGTPNPNVGQTQSLPIEHQGSCAVDDGGFECIGVLLGTSPWNPWDPSWGKPPTLGGCFRIPPPTGSCWFVSPTASVDIGRVQAGSGGRASTTILYACEGSPPAYRVSLSRGGSSVEDSDKGVSVGIKIGGGDLPYRLSDTSPGARDMEIELTVQTAPGTTGDFRATGVLELAPE